MGPVSRRRFLTTTGPASPASSPPACRPPGASSARSPTSAGTTSRPRPTRSWPRSASASPRTPASSSRSTTSPTWARSRPSTPPRSRRRPATTSSRCACTSRGSTSRSSWTSPTWWPSSRRSTARRSPPPTKARTSRASGARCLSITACSWRPIARISSRRPASRSPTPGRTSTRSARSSRRWGTRSGIPISQNYDSISTASARAVVLRRHGGGQGRQDGPHQLAGDRPDHRVVPEDVPRLHGARGAVLVGREQQRVHPAGQGGLDPQPGVAPTSWRGNRKLVTADGINHHRSLAGPQGRHETDVPRSHRDLEVLEEHRGRPRNGSAT